MCDDRKMPLPVLHHGLHISICLEHIIRALLRVRCQLLNAIENCLRALSSGSELLQVMDCSAFVFLYTKTFMLVQEHNDLILGTEDFRASSTIVLQHR